MVPSIALGRLGVVWFGSLAVCGALAWQAAPLVAAPTDPAAPSPSQPPEAPPPAPDPSAPGNTSPDGKATPPAPQAREPDRTPPIPVVPPGTTANTPARGFATTQTVGPAGGPQIDQPAPVAANPVLAAGQDPGEVWKKLQTPVTFRATGVPLKDLVAPWAKTAGLDIVIDEAALGGEAAARKALVSLDAGELTLESALSLVAEQHDLDWTIVDNVVLITHAHLASTKHLRSQLRDISDLVGGPQSTLSARELGVAITGGCSPSMWAEQSGPGEARYFGKSRQLLVRQTPRVQFEVDRLLAEIRRITAAPNSRPLPVMSDAVAKALAAKVEVRYRAQPLSEILADLSKQSGVKFPLDHVGLGVKPGGRSYVAASGLPPFGEPLVDDPNSPAEIMRERLATPCSLELGSARLETALDLLLESQGLAWTPLDGSILITTREGAAARLVTRVYSAAGLLDGDAGERSIADLVDLLIAGTGRETWDRFDGEGTIAPLGMLLVVRQTPQVHMRIEGFMAELAESIARASK